MDKTILIWDIENVSVKHLETIFSNLIYIPDISYAISKCKINKQTLKKLEEKNIKYIQSKRIADEMIIDLLNITLETRNNYILISSDSDFCGFTKLATEKGKNIQWFLQDCQKKRILMKNDITLSNIKYFLLENLNKKKEKRKKKEEKIESTKENKKIQDSKQKEVLKLRNSVKGSASKLSLNDLEDILKENLDKKENKESKIEKLLKERFIWIENRIKGIVERKLFIKTNNYCDFCGGLSKNTSRDDHFCLECEQKFVKKYKNLKELNHKEKIEKFYLETEKEIKETGNVIYTQETINLDLLELELSKVIQVPNKYKMENIIKG